MSFFRHHKIPQICFDFFLYLWHTYMKFLAIFKKSSSWLLVLLSGLQFNPCSLKLTFVLKDSNGTSLRKRQRWRETFLRIRIQKGTWILNDALLSRRMTQDSDTTAVKSCFSGVVSLTDAFSLLISLTIERYIMILAILLTLQHTKSSQKIFDDQKLLLFIFFPF